MAITMTKLEFLNSLPEIIDHKAWGHSQLEIITDGKEAKGVCYRNIGKIASGGTYGATWFEVYQKLLKYLKKEGYINKN